MLTAVTITGPASALVEAVAALRDRAAAVRLPLELSGVATARHVRSQLVNQCDDYLLPRLRRPEAPLLVVVGGSTGAGKSTLVNSLVRRQVSKAGVLRPTTRTPVLVAHPDDVPDLVGPERMLARLVRTKAVTGKPDTIVLTPSPAMPRGVAIIDAPDINSVVTENRELAERLMAAADAWLLVTTAERYADAVPWKMLNLAKQWHMPLGVVLDRVPPDILIEARDACRTLLRINGFGDAPLFTIPETVLTYELLPEYLLDPILGWLRTPAYDATARHDMVSRHLAGALDSLRQRIGTLAEAASAQASAIEALADRAEAEYALRRHSLGAAVEAGELFRGELQVCWQVFLGREDIQRLLAGNRPCGGLSAGIELRTTVIAATAGAIEAALRDADTRIADALRIMPGGSELASLEMRGQAVDSDGDPVRDWLTRRGATDEPPADGEAVTAEWLAALPALIRRQLDRRAERRRIGTGEGAAVLLSTAVLAGTASGPPRHAGLPDVAEQQDDEPLPPAPPRSAAADAAHELAAMVMGPSEAPRLVEMAREELDSTLATLFTRVAARRRRKLAELGVDAQVATLLRDAHQRVERSR